MKIKIVSTKQYMELEKEFGARVCYYDLDIEVANLRAMSDGTMGLKYIPSSFLERTIEEVLTFQKVKKYLKRNYK